MDFFFDKGKLLRSEKTKTIRAFFSPIDHLFGDYELRKVHPLGMAKKASLAHLLYRRNAAGAPFKITSEMVVEQLKSDDFLLGLIISEVNHELRLDHCWISPHNLQLEENNITVKIRELTAEGDPQKRANIKFPVLILEPTYLARIVPKIEGYIDARIGQYKDGRYVVFLHPKRNESDMPIRIPRPPKDE